MVSRWFARPSALRSDLCFLALGTLIGWQLDCVSRVDGPSMYPTLRPDDRILHVPLWVARWWRRDERDVVRVGDVVVAQVGETHRVCKRVRRILTSQDEVDKLHDVAFQWADHWSTHHLPAHSTIGSDSDELHDDTNAFKDDGEEERDTVAAVEEVPQPPTTLGASAASVCRDLRNDPSDDDEEGADIAAVADTEGEDGVDHRPFRSREWDWCIEGDLLPSSSSMWVWLEGDNASDSFDSRHVGSIPAHCLRGVVLQRVWPLWPR